MRDRAKAQRERKKLRRTAALGACESAATVGKTDATLASYLPEQRILLVGEGDFSFAHSLVELLGSAHNLTASALDTAAQLAAKYPDIQQRLAALRSRGASIAPGVDATTMAHGAWTGNKSFDRVVYNFPYAHVTKFSKDHLVANQELLRRFYACAAQLLRPGGEVHLRNKLNEPYRSWDLASLLPASLTFVGAAPFDARRFPGYANRSNWGAGAQGYSVSDSRTYVFRREPDGGRTPPTPSSGRARLECGMAARRPHRRRGSRGTPRARQVWWVTIAKPWLRWAVR